MEIMSFLVTFAGLLSGVFATMYYDKHCSK